MSSAGSGSKDAWYALVDMGYHWKVYVRYYKDMRRFDHKLADATSKGMEQLQKDWDFVNVLLYAMNKWSDAAELLQQSDRHSFLGKINACEEEICRECQAKHFIDSRYNPRCFLIQVRECQRITDALLKEEFTGGSLESISSLVFKVCYSYSSIQWVRTNLKHILMDGDKDGFLGKHLGVMWDELKLIRDYLDQVKSFGLSSKLDNHAFVTHVGSVVVRIAIQSCDYWFNRKDTDVARVKALGLVNLRHQIDPSNPEFMKLILDFQQVVSNEKSKTTTASLNEETVGHFFTYILNSCSNKDTGKRLMSLVTLYNTTMLRSHSGREDVQCLFAEIQVLVTEAALLHHARQEIETVYLHSCSYLLSKICILETEFFLKEQLSAITSSVPFSNTKIVEFESVLKNLSSVTTDLCQHKDTEYGKQSSVLIAQLDGEVQSLYESVQSKKMTDSMMKHLLFQLVFKMVFFKAESFLSELSTSQTGESFIDDGKQQIESFMLELNYLKQVVSNQLVRNLRDKEILLLLQIEAVGRMASFLSYSFLPDNDKFTEFLLSLPDLLNKVKDIKAKLEEVSSLIPWYSLPKTIGLGFIDFLGRNIREVLKCDTESIRPIKNLLEQAQSYLEAFKSIFTVVSDSDILRGELNGVCTQLTELAYKLEYVVESIEIDGRLEHSLRLYDLLEDIRLVYEQVSNVSETSSAAELKCPPASEVSCKRLSMDTSPAISEMNVDLVDEERAIIDLLMRGSSRRDVVSIVGMPGIGKTTLAGKVYSSKNVVYHFPRRAWCNVSQVYSKRDLLLDLLSGLDGNPNKFDGMSNDELLSKLRRCLLGSRYLIVLDDVWDTSAWDDLQISFPDDRNGSRILITSRLRDVHLAVNPGSDPHLIRSFSDGESWMLLEKKIFEGGNCPSQLLLVGKKIAEHCQGLPLAVVAVAGLLQKTAKTKDWWEKISDRISSQLMTDPSPENRCKEILELSYKHLPEYLKPCFLYMGVFLRDRDFSEQVDAVLVG